MRPVILSALVSLLISTSTAASASAPASAVSPINPWFGPNPPPAIPPFTYNRTTFLLHGKPFQIIGGQMDPQRIPHQYWRDRLSKARAMGLNTIFSYVYWNLLEPEMGRWTWDDAQNDIAAYFRIAQEEGLHVVLRPGPYICGEREWGGFPYWLSTVPNLTVRTYNAPYLHYSKIYLQQLATKLQPVQITRGGPLLMVQVENEYGSYDSNHNYTSYLRDVLRELYDVPLYTNDGSEDWTLRGGSVPGVLAEIDGGPTYGFKGRDAYITDTTQLGPLLDGEYYTLAPDNWGQNVSHFTTTANPDPKLLPGILSDLNFVLNASNSISIYMFHGGTNFGLSAGAIWANYSKVFTTSYDYGAPLDESGRLTPLYHTLRALIQQYVPAHSIPEPPADLPRLALPTINLRPATRLFDMLGAPTSTAEHPVTMEALGQAYGFVLYSHTVSTPVSGLLQAGDRARDRILVFINGVRAGVIDSTYIYPQNVTVALRAGDALQLLVENLGRVDYFSPPSGTFNALLDPWKGVVGAVRVGNETLLGWEMFSLPLDKIPAASSSSSPSSSSPFPPFSPFTAPPSFNPNALSSSSSASQKTNNQPLFYTGTFTLPPNTSTSDPRALDTFLAIPAGYKGVVWINSFMLGRYWKVGPQQSLYLPGTLLKPGQEENEIVVLELEPGEGELAAEGLSERVWGNFRDVDYPGDR